MKQFTLAHLIKIQEIILPTFTIEDPLTFVSQEDNSKIAFGSDNDFFSIRYSKDSEWEDYILGTEITLNKRTICSIFGYILE